jgi:hypothetical protein
VARVRSPGTVPAPGARYVMLACVLPIVAGGIVYLLFRDPRLWMFRWAAWIGLDGLIAAARVHSLPHGPSMPEWLLFSFPDGVWVFAGTAFFARLWHDGRWAQRLCWIGVAPAMAIGGEVGQALGLVPGTFDGTDLVSYAVAAALALGVATAAVGRARRSG